ncbi:MAG: TRAP transporter small permease [Pseudomonadota bacterium]|nr:TRAP transporter small permease [Pseudomonadota bacterium]
MSSIDRFTKLINHIFVWISGSALLLMMVLGFSNVLSRTFWQPIKGTFEIIGFLGALCTAMALGYTQMRKNHVGVDIITNKYSKRWQRITEILSYMITAPFFVVAAWQVAAWGTTIRLSGETSETLQLTYYPVIYVVAAGFFFLALVLFYDLYKEFKVIFNGANGFTGLSNSATRWATGKKGGKAAKRSSDES